MVARIDGEQWSRGTSASMHHRFERCIAEVSAGQTVELEIEGIGVLRNRIVRG